MWVVFGETASKSNSSQIVRFGNHSAIIKSKKARAYEKIFLAQVRPTDKDKIPEGEVILTAHIYYATHRPDLDESLVMDCIQESKLLKNDRQIREKHVFHHIDRQNPRVEFMLAPRNPSFGAE